ncbi:MAG: arylsulfatase [Planctomycetota bacterium]
MNRSTLAALWIVLCSFATACAAQPEEAPRPHIVMIMADDMGWADVSYHGGEIATPEIDALMKQGRRLDRFYVQPQCTPTRAALLTGKYPLRTATHYGVILPHSQWGLPLDEVTMADLLNQAGYRTTMVGKWHMGHHAEAYLPENRGFDHFFGHYLGSHDYFKHGHAGGYDQHRNRQVTREEGYATDLFAKEAVQLISTHRGDQPLFLYLSFNAPHDPWQSKPEDMAGYEHMTNLRRTYAGMMTAMDRAIGEVADALEEAGMADNTLIVFCSDNGGPHAGKATDNGPLRGGKGQTYEGGVRVPAFAVWPARIPAGSASDELLYIGDLYPTFGGLAGADLSAVEADLDGLDVRATLTDGAPSGRQELALISGPDWFWNAIYEGPWKLNRAVNTENQGQPIVKLFHLEDDPNEQVDLLEAEPEVAARLQAKLDAWIEAAEPSRFTYEDAKGEPPAVWGQFEDANPSASP